MLSEHAQILQSGMFVASVTMQNQRPTVNTVLEPSVCLPVKQLHVVFCFNFAGGWCFAPSRRSSDFSEARKLLAAYPGGSVDLEKDEQRGMAKILLNNPGKKNAFSGECLPPFPHLDVPGAVQGRRVRVSCTKF